MYAYGASPDAFTNVREAAKQPWMGITAILGNKPYLVVGKEGDTFVLEGEDGDTQRLESFEWADATDENRLVAASRLENSPFEPGSVLGAYVVGNLVFMDGEWGVRIGHSDLLLPLEEMVEICDDLRYSKAALNAEIQKTAVDGPRLWLVTREGDVLIQPDDMIAQNHYKLAAAMLGKDWLKAQTDGIGYGGTIEGDQITYSGWMGNESGIPPKHADPFGSTVGAARVHKAVAAVYEAAQAQGIPVQPNYTLNKSVPGQGLVPTQRALAKEAGPGVPFGPCPNCGGDNVMQQPDSWLGECPNCGERNIDPYEPMGNIGPRVDDAPHGGMPFGSPSSPRHWFSWNEQKTAANFTYTAGPAGIHGASGEAFGALGIQLMVTVPPMPGEPEPLTAPLPGGSFDIAMHGLDLEDWTGVPIEVETDADPWIVTLVLDVMGGIDRDADLAQAPEEVRNVIERLGRKVMGAANKEDQPLVCPNCGSHTKRALDVGDEALLKCLTCGNEWTNPAVRNPEAKVGWVIEAMRPPEAPNNVDTLRSDVIKTLGLDRISYEENMQINGVIKDMISGTGPIGQLPHRALESVSWQKVVDQIAAEVARQFGIKSPDQAAEEWPDFIPWDDAEQDYYRGASIKEANIPQWFLQGLEIAGITGGIGAGAMGLLAGTNVAYLWHQYRMKYGENPSPPVVVAEGVKDFVKSVRGEFDYPEDVMNRVRDKSAAEGGKLNPGTRIQIDHQAHKGQRGTIVEYKGKHEDFEEEQYKVLLDSGEELDEVNESFFHKIKSANVVDNSRLPNTPEQFNLDTMKVSFDPMMRGLDAGMGMDDESEFEIPECPACGGPGGLMGALGQRVYFRCRNCGLDFSKKDEPVEPLADPATAAPPETVAPMGGQPVPLMPGSPINANPAMPIPRGAKTSKWNDVTGQPLTAGGWYRMHHKDYKVPDVVRILNLEDNRIEAAIESDEQGAFPIIIGEDHEYSFEAYESVEEAPIETEAGWKIARRNFSPSEQRDLIEENKDGRARNIDKLDLSGTHYETKHSYDEDPNFLWGG
jgi:hypothetical protein